MQATILIQRFIWHKYLPDWQWVGGRKRVLVHTLLEYAVLEYALKSKIRIGNYITLV